MLEKWLDDFAQKIKENFAERIVFIGIQGSYARGEATDASDIDVVVILDEVLYPDLKKYDNIISGLPDREKICGFISGEQELQKWDRSDLFQFYHDTIPLYGSLDWMKDVIKYEDIVRAVHLGACNIYHMCVHNAVHEKSPEILKSLLKSAVFVIQAKYYCETGNYVKRKDELLEKVCADDREILQFLVNEAYQNAFEDVSERLMLWAGERIKEAK